MQCKKCNRDSVYLLNGMCSGCWSFPDNIDYLIYNYKCPDCKGEFNNPAFIPAPGSAIAGTYKCPFCGRMMLGVKMTKIYFKCQKCGRKNQITIIGEGLFECVECGTVFVRQFDIKADNYEIYMQQGMIK